MLRNIERECAIQHVLIAAASHCYCNINRRARRRGSGLIRFAHSVLWFPDLIVSAIPAAPPHITSFHAIRMRNCASAA
jgi:hypothetical protein